MLELDSRDARCKKEGVYRTLFRIATIDTTVRGKCWRNRYLGGTKSQHQEVRALREKPLLTSVSGSSDNLGAFGIPRIYVTAGV
jgi:hypothetical protein